MVRDLRCRPGVAHRAGAARSQRGRGRRAPCAGRPRRRRRQCAGLRRAAPGGRRVSPPSSRARLPDPGARTTDTSGARFGVPLTSIRPSVFSGERAGLTAVRDRISMPSRPTSTSARSTAPTFSPAGTSAPSTVPLGWRAPAARQVHDPSPVWLVNSMSIRRDMRRTRYLAGPQGPMPEVDGHPVTWQGRPPECRSRRDRGPPHRRAA